MLGSNNSQLTQLRTGAIEFFMGTGSGMGGLKQICGIEMVGYAFNDYASIFRAYDGALGERMRTELGQIGATVIGKWWAGGFSAILNSLRPIRTPEDYAGIKLRVTTLPLLLDLFSSLGASPVPIPGPDTYSALQTHIVDGMQSNLAIFEGQHYYEISKYLSLTNHNFSMYVLLANQKVWEGLPANVKAIITRNADKSATLERADIAANDRALITKLAQQGLVLNTPPKEPFRAKLGAYYGRMKTLFGADVWSLLEATTGQLG